MLILGFLVFEFEIIFILLVLIDGGMVIFFLIVVMIVYEMGVRGFGV